MKEPQRFEAGYVKDEAGCWIWIKALNEKGYGQFRFNGRNGRAHQYAFLTYKGVVPDGLVIDHLCGVRRCVNPDHLEAVTNKENILRGVGPTAQNAKKTHCPRGHELSGDNLLIQKGSMRTCRMCNNEQQRAWRERQKPRPESPKIHHPTCTGVHTGIWCVLPDTPKELDIDESSGVAFLRETECCEKCNHREIGAGRWISWCIKTGCPCHNRKEV